MHALAGGCERPVAVPISPLPRRARCRAAPHRCRARGCATATGLLPVGLLAQQRLTEPVELGDDLLRRCGNGLAGPFAQLFQLPGHLRLDLGGHLVPGQGTQLLPGLTHRSPQILRRGMGFADHLPAFAHRRFQPVQFAHGSLLAGRPGQGRSDPGRQCGRTHCGDAVLRGQHPGGDVARCGSADFTGQRDRAIPCPACPRASGAVPRQAINQHDAGRLRPHPTAPVRDSGCSNSWQRPERLKGPTNHAKLSDPGWQSVPITAVLHGYETTAVPRS